MKNSPENRFYDSADSPASKSKFLLWKPSANLWLDLKCCFIIWAKTTLLLLWLLASLQLHLVTLQCFADDAELQQKALVQAGALAPEQQLMHIAKKLGKKNPNQTNNNNHHKKNPPHPPSEAQQGWDVGSWKEGVRDGTVQAGVARAARSCKEDVPAPHSLHQLPEQDLARASEETQALNLQVQNYSSILQV